MDKDKRASRFFELWFEFVSRHPAFRAYLADYKPPGWGWDHRDKHFTGKYDWGLTRCNEFGFFMLAHSGLDWPKFWEFSRQKLLEIYPLYQTPRRPRRMIDFVNAVDFEHYNAIGGKEAGVDFKEYLKSICEDNSDRSLFMIDLSGYVAIDDIIDGLKEEYKELRKTYPERYRRSRRPRQFREEKHRDDFDWIVEEYLEAWKMEINGMKTEDIKNEIIRGNDSKGGLEANRDRAQDYIEKAMRISENAMRLGEFPITSPPRLKGGR